MSGMVWFTSHRGGSLAGDGLNSGSNRFIHFCQSGSNFLLSFSNDNANSWSVTTGSPSGTDLVRGWLSSLFARASQSSADMAETFGFAGPCWALHCTFCVDASSSEDKALRVILPMRIVFNL
jgi:hypothetical protein